MQPYVTDVCRIRSTTRHSRQLPMRCERSAATPPTITPCWQLGCPQCCRPLSHELCRTPCQRWLWPSLRSARNLRAQNKLACLSKLVLVRVRILGVTRSAQLVDLATYCLLRSLTCWPNFNTTITEHTLSGA
jgi:hypothetical protein